MKKCLISPILFTAPILWGVSISSYAEDICPEPKIIPKLSTEDHEKLHNLCVSKIDVNYADCLQEHIPLFIRKNTQRELHLYLSKCQDEQNENYKKVASQLAPPSQPPKPVDPPAESQSSGPWLVSASIGKQFLPDYENGATGGLDKSQSFAEIVIDHRDDNRKQERHWGAMLTFEGQPVHVDSDESINDVEFNDVADTMTAGLYFVQMLDTEYHQGFDCILLCNSEGALEGQPGWQFDSKWGYGAKVSLRSRESLGDMGDSVDEIIETGLHYRYNEYKGEIGQGNVMPRGTLSLGIGYWNDYEDYIGATDSKYRWRILVRGEYRLNQQIPLYLGFKGNLGKGADAVAAYLSLRIHTNKLIGLLTDY